MKNLKKDDLIMLKSLREDEGISNLMVCVTAQRSCERLVVHGATRRLEGQDMYVVNCVQTGRSFLEYDDDPAAIEYLFDVASSVGAQLTILRENNVIDALVNFAIEHNIGTIIVGVSPNKGKDSFTGRFNAKLPGVEFDIVS